MKVNTAKRPNAPVTNPMRGYPTPYFILCTLGWGSSAQLSSECTTSSFSTTVCTPGIFPTSVDALARHSVARILGRTSIARMDGREQGGVSFRGGERGRAGIERSRSPTEHCARRGRSAAVTFQHLVMLPSIVKLISWIFLSVL